MSDTHGDRTLKTMDHLWKIHFGKVPEDIDFHPSDELAAVGLNSGDLLVYRYAADSLPQRVLEVPAHSLSCRAVRFYNEGRGILTGSQDCSILATDVETGSSIARLQDSHRFAVNRLVNLTASTFASGGDEGCIKVWDMRGRSCCNSFYAHKNYISDLTFAPDFQELLATSGDGTLSVCNLRSNMVKARSEFTDDELLSVVIIKNGGNIVCATESGSLLIYSWGSFKNFSDRFMDLSPNPVAALLKHDEDTVITGSETGHISLVGILPNRVIKSLSFDSEYPVEHLGSGNTALSSSAEEDSDGDEVGMDIILRKSSGGIKRKHATIGQASNSLFADL